MPPIEPTSAVPQSVTQSLQSAGQMGAERQRGQQQAFQASEKAKVDREAIAARTNEATRASAIDLIQGEQALLDSRMKSVQEARNFEALNANKLEIAQLSADASTAAREQRGREHSAELQLQKDAANRIQENYDAEVASKIAMVTGTMEATEAQIEKARELSTERNLLTMKMTMADRAVKGSEDTLENVVRDTTSEYEKIMGPLRQQRASVLTTMASDLAREFGTEAYGIPDRGADQGIVDAFGYVITSIGQAVNDFVSPYEDRAAVQQAVRLGKNRAGSGWAGGEGAISSRLSNVKGVDLKDFVHRQIANAVINATGIKMSERGHAVELLVQAYGAVEDGSDTAHVRKIREEFFRVTNIDSALLDTMQESAYAVIKKRMNFYQNAQVPKTFEDSYDPDTMLTLERGNDAEGNPLAPLEISEWNATLMREVYDPEYLKGPGVFSVHGFGLNGMEDFVNDISTLEDETPQEFTRFISEMEAAYPGAEEAFGGKWETAIDDLASRRDEQKGHLEGFEEFGFEEKQGLNMARLDANLAEATARKAALEELLRERGGG